MTLRDVLELFTFLLPYFNEDELDTVKALLARALSRALDDGEVTIDGKK